MDNNYGRLKCMFFEPYLVVRLGSLFTLVFELWLQLIYLGGLVDWNGTSEELLMQYLQILASTLIFWV